MTVVRDQLFPQKPPGSRFRFSRTGVQPSPGSSTIELPSAFAESGAYPPDREPPGSPRQCSLPLACRHPPEGHQIGARKRRTPENTILSQPYCRRVSTDRSDREGSQLAASLEGEPGPTPAGKTLPHSYPETRFRRERAVSEKKTEAIHLWSDLSTASNALQIEEVGQRYKQKIEIVYLGCLISKSADLDAEIKRRIDVAWVHATRYSFQLHNQRNTKLSLKTKLPKAEVVEAML